MATSHKRRAWCDRPDHIVIRIGETEHGFDLPDAWELYEQLGLALVLGTWSSDQVIKSIHPPATMKTHNKPGEVIL